VGRCFEVCSGTMFLGMQWDDVFRYAVGRCFSRDRKFLQNIFAVNDNICKQEIL
jgi:hypothetical protein